MKTWKSNQRGNILLVANYPSDVGYAWWLMENYWAEIANHFHEKEVDTYLIFPKLNSVPMILRSSPITLIEHDFNDVSVRGVKKLKAIINDNNISNIYLTDKAYFSFKYWWLRKIGIKHIILHDHTPGERERPGHIKFSAKKIMLNKSEFTCDKYIGVSKFVYKRFVNVVGLPEGKCTYVLNGIRPINPNTETCIDVRSEFHLPSDAIVVVSVSRATRYKGVEFIIECANQLINYKKIDDLYFVHYGDGPDVDFLKAKVFKYNLGKRFHFGGCSSDIRRLLLSCDIALHASKGEAFSLSILEYLSASLATIVPDNCGNREAVVHQYTGLVYTSGDMSDAVQCLLRVISDPVLRSQLGDSGRHSVKEKFSLQRANKELLQVVDAVFS